jgi:DNA-binding MarR family transcriptional regulator
MIKTPPNLPVEEMLSAVPRATQSWLSVVRAYNLCNTLITQRLADIGISVGEHEVLANLARSPGMTQQQLASHSFVVKSGISMLLTRMEQQGVVERRLNLTDARVKQVFLTRVGLALAHKTLQIQAQVVNDMAAMASEQELDVVQQVMSRVSAKLEERLKERPRGS